MATTTAEAIRDRAITVIAALVPTSLAAERFVAYRNEGDGDFRTWAKANLPSSRRVFQVRTDGTDQSPAASNFDVEEHWVTVTVIVAYPQTSRDGAAAALDRDDAIDRDRHQIESAIGLRGGANFAAPYPDACYRDSTVTRELAGGVDFLVISQRMTFYRAFP